MMVDGKKLLLKRILDKELDLSVVLLERYHATDPNEERRDGARRLHEMLHDSEPYGEQAAQHATRQDAGTIPQGLWPTWVLLRCLCEHHSASLRCHLRPSTEQL